MRFPEKIVGLKWLTMVVAIFGVVWISLEGALWQAILLAVGLTLLGVFYLLQRLFGGRHMTVIRWLTFSSGFGVITGLTCALLTLVLMAVKTGLHGHGPEFTAAEIEWVASQLPLWMAAGLLAGLGVGLLVLATRRPEK